MTKDDYENTLRANQQQQDEMNSAARERALARINNGVMRV